MILGAKLSSASSDDSHLSVSRLNLREAALGAGFGFLLLDGIVLNRVTINSDAGVLRGTRADGVLASSATSALASLSSLSRQRSHLYAIAVSDKEQGKPDTQEDNHLSVFGLRSLEGMEPY